jgi:hypothetical protein
MNDRIVRDPHPHPIDRFLEGLWPWLFLPSPAAVERQGELSDVEAEPEI